MRPRPKRVGTCRDCRESHSRKLTDHTASMWLPFSLVRQAMLNNKGEETEAPSPLRESYLCTAYLTREPGATSPCGLTTNRPLSSLAARIMPCDSMPMSLAGLRFATMVTSLPTSASGS